MRLSDIMSHAGLAGYAQVALILFLIAFIAIAIRIAHPSRTRAYRDAARLPLDDGEPKP